MGTWKKENGKTIKLNEEIATVKKAVSLGWVLIQKVTKRKKRKA